MENLMKEKSNLMKAVFILALLACIYVAVKIISEIKSYNFIGGGAPATNIISFDGKGEVFAVPDLATISFTIRDTQKEMKDAQDKVTAKESAVLSFLSSSGIDKEDIKTENYSSYPKYDYGTPCYGYIGIPCRQEEAKIVGYEVSEYVTVKIRDIAKAGDIVQGIGAVGVSEMNGPNFSIENEDKLKETARKLAIDEAKAKAKILSHDLGVRLVRIVNFSENGNYPIMYANKGIAMMDSAVSEPAASPELPTGENKIISNVTITYEIR